MLPINRRKLLAAIGGAAIAPTAARTDDDLPVSTRELWGWVRAQQVVDPSITYLDTATVGPGLRGALAIHYRQLEQFNTDADTYMNTHMTASVMQNLLRRLGGFLNCQGDELAVTQGASEALALVAHGLRSRFSAGDEVIIAAHAHNTAIYPWLVLAERSGIVVKQVAFPIPLAGGEQVLGAIAGAVTKRTRMIVVSHVQHTDGAIVPVADICSFARQRDILTLIDGAQACGSIDVDIGALGCDFYAASLHKWLNAPDGLGLLYVRPPLLPELAPFTTDTNLGWDVINRFGQASIDADTDRSAWPATLAKFGCNLRFVLPKLKALEAVLDFREQLGTERVEARIRELAIYARLRLQPSDDLEILTPAQPGMWGGILTFRPKHVSATELALRLRRSNRIVTAAIHLPASPTAPEFSALRLSPHIYNSHEDIERLVRALV